LFHSRPVKSSNSKVDKEHSFVCEDIQTARLCAEMDREKARRGVRWVGQRERELDKSLV
jgi:ribosomal protein L15E